MSIETLLTGLIAALEANTAALSGKPAGKPTAADKPAAADKPKATPQKTGDEVVAIMEKLKAAKGAPAAKEIIKNCGFGKLADLITDGTKNNEAFKAAEAAIAAEDDM